MYIINICKKLNINNNINTNNNLIITSAELINKVKLVRINLKMFDETQKNYFEIRKFLTCKVLNMNNFITTNSINSININNDYLFVSNISFNSFELFDDELEPILLD